MLTDIKTNIIKMIDNHVPTKMSTKRFNQPWKTTEVIRKARQKKRSYNKVRTTNNPKDHVRYSRTKDMTKKTCKKAYTEYINNIIGSEENTNSKRSCGFIKSKRCDNTGVAPLKHQTSGITYSDNKTKANILNEQFSSVFNKNGDKNNITKKESPHPSMPEIKIHENGIFKLLNDLNIHKATGPDGIPAQVRKELAHELTPVMSLFFQASVNQGRIPDEWKEANVVPIFKKGDKSKAVNYRPGDRFTKVIVNRKSKITLKISLRARIRAFH